MSTDKICEQVSSENFFLMLAAEATGIRIGECLYRIETEGEDYLGKGYMALKATKLVQDFQKNLEVIHPKQPGFHDIVLEHVDFFAKHHVEDRKSGR